MELELEEFEKLCEHYHITLDLVIEGVDEYVKANDNTAINSKCIYACIVPMHTYPPRVSIVYCGNEPGSLQRQLGYFNVSRYIKNNIH